jgi:hypothetical protein
MRQLASAASWRPRGQSVYQRPPHGSYRDQYDEVRIIERRQQRDARGQPQGAAPTRCFSLSDLMNRYKSMTTHQYIQGVKSKPIDHNKPSRLRIDSELV